MKNPALCLPLISLLLWLGLSATAQAGRPLNVDDASVDEAGSGHIETWYARQAGGVRGWTVAPAYAPVAGVEIGVSVARDNAQQSRSSTLQGKFLLSPAQERGCNAGVVAGVTQTTGTAGNTPAVNGLFSCNQDGGATHFNLGALRTPGGPTLRSWGLALERELGRFTGHAEWFGQQQSAPVFQIGLRTELAPGWQLDGSLGRTRQADRHATLFSLGFAKRF